jgi:hypothetical protein
MASTMSTDAETRAAEREAFARKWLRFIVVWTIVVGIILWWSGFLLTLKSGPWTEMYFQHFPVTMGIPSAMLGAMVICTLFRTTEGQIKFGGLGFHFEGAAGPIVMWVLCFLAQIAAIRFLWAPLGALACGSDLWSPLQETGRPAKVKNIWNKPKTLISVRFSVLDFCSRIRA